MANAPTNDDMEALPNKPPLPNPGKLTNTERERIAATNDGKIIPGPSDPKNGKGRRRHHRKTTKRSKRKARKTHRK